MSGTEETNSGIKHRGTWEEVSEFAERIEEVTSESFPENAVEEFSKWRPKLKEAENDLKHKTVEEALLDEQPLEEDAEPVEEIKHASEEIVKAGTTAKNGEIPDNEVVEVSESIFKTVFSGIMDFFRKIESFAYDNVLLRSDRWYFDTEGFSADMKSLRNGEYEMNVNLKEKKSRQALQKEFRNE